MPNPPPHLLVLESSKAAYDEVLASLALGGALPRARRVCDTGELAAGLAEGPVDAALLGHPGGVADLEALVTALRQSHPDLPVLVVTTGMGAGAILGLLQAGAEDVIARDSLYRLTPALARSLASARERAKVRTTAAALAEREARLLALTRHLETVKEEERHRIAREIHDDIGATLTALRFDLVGLARQADADLAPRLAPMLGLLGQAVAASHRIQHNLRPPVLDAGLVAALQWLVRNFASRAGIPATFETNREDPPIPTETAAAMYRVAQESLSNIAKYAQAARAGIQLFTAEGEVTLEITDDGMGFDPGMLRATPGFGLRGLIERARGLGGWAEISSAPGRGTTVMFCVPLGALAPAPPDPQGALALEPGPDTHVPENHRR